LRQKKVLELLKEIGRPISVRELTEELYPDLDKTDKKTKRQLIHKKLRQLAKYNLCKEEVKKTKVKTEHFSNGFTKKVSHFGV